jgi:hypothetical protein
MPTQTKPNDCAFPSTDSTTNGLTKREWFAGIVASGVLGEAQTRSRIGVECADLLIKELNRDTDHERAKEARHQHVRQIEKHIANINGWLNEDGLNPEYTLAELKVAAATILAELQVIETLTQG